MPTSVPPSDPAPDSGRSKFAARLLRGGAEPDPRFTLANERTFLAWIRTSLALLAGGIAVEAFTSDLLGPEIRKTTAILLLVLAMVIGAGAFFRWLGVERAMRQKAPLPLPVLAPILAIGGALVGAIFVVFVVLRPA
ncbi:YidH family protein [Arthrobacter sp. USHLN218]|uniref:YidH family protein n=1 Tax=Arthrobacter sp. USHLN218 TaxID=3081232 RepID=UPI00301AFC4A